MTGSAVDFYPENGARRPREASSKPKKASSTFFNPVNGGKDIKKGDLAKILVNIPSSEIQQQIFIYLSKLNISEMLKELSTFSDDSLSNLKLILNIQKPEDLAIVDLPKIEFATISNIEYVKTKQVKLDTLLALLDANTGMEEMIDLLSTLKSEVITTLNDFLAKYHYILPEINIEFIKTAADIVTRIIRKEILALKKIKPLLNSNCTSEDMVKALQGLTKRVDVEEVIFCFKTHQNVLKIDMKHFEAIAEVIKDRTLSPYPAVLQNDALILQNFIVDLIMPLTKFNSDSTVKASVLVLLQACIFFNVTDKAHISYVLGTARLESTLGKGMEETNVDNIKTYEPVVNKAGNALQPDDIERAKNELTLRDEIDDAELITLIDKKKSSEDSTQIEALENQIKDRLKKLKKAARKPVDLGNIKKGDGNRFKGRGFVQVTGRANYSKFSNDTELVSLVKSFHQEDSMNFVDSPSLIAVPKVAAAIAVVGMRDGKFLNHKLSEYKMGENFEFFNAREIINVDKEKECDEGNYKGKKYGTIVEEHARAYFNAIKPLP